jgi:hypothetical protein
MLLTVPAIAAKPRQTCEWQSPGRDPFMGEVPAAVDHYTDIPPATRTRLKVRMAKFAYDDIVAIRRDAIEGNFGYAPTLLDMHFGKGGMCGEVTRKTWRADHEERGLVYCEDGQCIVVPLVCRNVSRIIRQPSATGAGESPEPLVFDPPGAGMPQDVGPTPRVMVAELPYALGLPAMSVPSQPVIGAATALPPSPGFQVPFIPPLPPTPAVAEPAKLLLWVAGLVAGSLWCRRRHAAAPQGTP